MCVSLCVCCRRKRAYENLILCIKSKVRCVKSKESVCSLPLRAHGGRAAAIAVPLFLLSHDSTRCSSWFCCCCLDKAKGGSEQITFPFPHLCVCVRQSECVCVCLCTCMCVYVRIYVHMCVFGLGGGALSPLLGSSPSKH